jgi:hypothetical protein
MPKLSNVNEWLFNNIDNFFQGTERINSGENSGHLHPVNVLNTNYIEWELNQDIFDIAFCDIKCSFSWIIPRFIRKLAGRVKQLGLLYLYTDVAEEEISGRLVETRETAALTLEKAKKTVFSFPQRINDITVAKCLSISNWLKIEYNKLRLFVTMGLLRKPYYLLGTFAPYGYEVPETETTRLIKEFNWFKLNPAFAFHKRI